MGIKTANQVEFVEFPLPWERVLWTGRPVVPSRRRYGLSDLRLVCLNAGHVDEIALYDVADVRVWRSPVDRVFGAQSIAVHARANRRAPLELCHLRHASQLAAVIELVAAEAPNAADQALVQAALRWKGPDQRSRWRGLTVGVSGLLLTLALAVVALEKRAPAPALYPVDDAIAPAGVKRDQASIERFMESMVMPWARQTLAPIVGGADRVTCATCHGSTAEARRWRMPAVAALPRPMVRELGWENYSQGMDPQLRNAIYGYVAESDNQAKAAYMREVVMPGMARLLHRPTYDFTQTYDYNRARQAFGCYHCHRVT